MPAVAVFDTNILISSVLSLRGNPFRCVVLAKIGLVESVTCDPILDEFEGKLQAKFRYPPHLSRRARVEVRGFSRMVSISGQLKVVTADPDDDKVLECGVAGGASHIVTGDRRHLLPLGTFRGIQIVTAAEFVALGHPL